MCSLDRIQTFYQGTLTDNTMFAGTPLSDFKVQRCNIEKNLTMRLTRDGLTPISNDHHSDAYTLQTYIFYKLETYDYNWWE